MSVGRNRFELAQLFDPAACCKEKRGKKKKASPAIDIVRPGGVL